MPEPLPGDVTAAAAALAPLATFDDDDPRWSTIAAPTQWTAARTVEHIADALLFYAAQVARRARHRLPVLRDGRPAPACEQVDNGVTAAHVLEALLRDLGSARAWHPSGVADAGGWVGMAVTEILVHGHDAAAALGVELPLPGQVCACTLARVFPWVTPAAAEPDQLLLAVTGRSRIPRRTQRSRVVVAVRAAVRVGRPPPPPDQPTRLALKRHQHPRNTLPGEG